MADTNTPRRVLQDLPVNTFGTPKAIHLPHPNGLKLKRPFQEVEDSASPPASSRPRLSDDAESKPSQICSKPALEPLRTTASGEREDDVVRESTQDTSNDVGSSFVDSDMEGDTMGTQQTAATELSQHTRPPTLSHAETLRLRLRLALFKVQTDQTNIPLSQLRVPSHEPANHHGSAGASPPCNLRPTPTLLPAPILKPTAYSIRRVEQSQMLSSPPCSGVCSPAKDSTPETFRTSALPRQRARSLQQLSSPPNSHDGELEEMKAEERHLSSSAIKGHAAASLLDLREDRR
ncbi:MAG: hypothetical protein Q9201_003419 [Fulgogasparrea decipioides]